jgi:hypothetical protein
MIVSFDKRTRDKAVNIECFNSVECIERAFYKEFMKDEKEVNYGKHDKNVIGTMDLYILVNVDYMKYDKIKEFLKF